MSVYLKCDERLDDLQYKGLKIIQHPNSFCFGTDAVLLADFVKLKRDETVLDLGTGTGILPILLSARYEHARFTGVEILPDMADMAARSVKLNSLQHKIEIFEMDLREVPVKFGHGKFDVVVCNPPYFSAGPVGINGARSTARHQKSCNLEEIALAAGKSLRFGGRLFLIYPCERLSDMVCGLRDNSLEIKRIRTIHSGQKTAPALMLIQASKGGKPGIIWESPLITLDESGHYTSEMNRIYHREENEC